MPEKTTFTDATGEEHEAWIIHKSSKRKRSDFRILSEIQIRRIADANISSAGHQCLFWLLLQSDYELKVRYTLLKYVAESMGHSVFMVSKGIKNLIEQGIITLDRGSDGTFWRFVD
jgi:hypothetical protein